MPTNPLIKVVLTCLSLTLLLAACVQPTAQTPLPTATITPTANDYSLSHYPSKAKFQVFIINPLRTCLAGNEFASGSVCYGQKCGDCDCAREDFDPPAPMSGIPPDRIDDAEYAQYDHRVCLNITLTPDEVQDIKNDMLLVAEKVYMWSGGDLELDVTVTELPHDFTGFVAPEYIIGPFEIDDELLNDYVGVDTDFVYVVNGVYDREQNLNLAFMCGGSYGEMSIHGAGYSNIQYGGPCNSVTIDGEEIYEPLIHEWYHNLDWALANTNRVTDIYEGKNPDWANWKHASWPACGASNSSFSWFPSIDFCEWDPDWIDCNNTASAGRCVHAGEVDGEMSWYEHVIRAHYPGAIHFIGNYCRDGRKDISETGIDSGWPCP